MGWLVLALLAACGAGIVLIDAPAASLGLADGRADHLVKAVAMIASIGGALGLSQLPRAGIGFRQAASWTAIALAVVSLYAYRGEIVSRGMELAGLAEADTEAGVSATVEQASQPRMVAISAMENGQFNVEALVNGTHVSMLADTGATLVVLTSEDAQRAGINLHALEFSVPLRTANGVTHGAIVELDEVDVGGIAVRRVEAVISQPGVLHHSLLGMSYLREIGTFELSGNQLILRE
jgi:aspartyl protease family protein